MTKIKHIVILILALILLSCNSKQEIKPLETFENVNTHTNILNYKITPKHKFDKNGLIFSDQGAWFGYSFPDSKTTTGFSGPFLMTQQNGVWISQNLAALDIENQDWITHETTSYTSHLEQKFTSKEVQLTQRLVFLSGHTALVKSEIKNISNQDITIQYQWRNTPILADNLKFTASKNQLKITSTKSNAIGYIEFPKTIESSNNTTYKTTLTSITLAKEASKEITISQSFIFPEYSWEEEHKEIRTSNFDSTLQSRKAEKETQLTSLINNSKLKFQDSAYNKVLVKSHLTLQNNWRIAAGEIKYEGLFPSYHYKWFNGFWSWDSWKHAVGLSYYNTDLAKEQMKLMFHFQKEDGFIVDCVFRDTLIEKHNYRDTKPPLSAWAVSKIYEKDKDIEFIKEFYPKLKRYHQWWYNKRDHDKDGLCEYGSTDGTLIAAKWESGMDNAIRFDNSKILKNAEGAYSLDQESVDLNAYLYAEKA